MLYLEVEYIPLLMTLLTLLHIEKSISFENFMVSRITNDTRMRKDKEDVGYKLRTHDYHWINFAKSLKNK